MFYKRHLLVALCTAIFSFSAYAMDELDEYVYNNIKAKHAPLFTELSNNLSELWPKKTDENSLASDNQYDSIISKIRKNIGELKISFHKRHKSQEDYNIFDKKCMEMRKDLAHLPNNIRTILVTNYEDKNTEDLTRFLIDPTWFPYEKFNSNLVKTDNDIYFVEYITDRHAQKNIHKEFSKNLKLHEEKSLRNIKKAAFWWYASTIAASAAICAGIAGTCYYLYKKYWKKEKGNVPNKPVIIHVKKRNNLHKNIAY